MFLRPIIFIARIGALTANFTNAVWKHTSLPTKVAGAVALTLGAGFMMNQRAEQATMPRVEAPRATNLTDNNAPPVGERIPVQPDMYGNITIPGAVIARVYMETIYDPETKRIIAMNPNASRRAELTEIAARNRAILLDAITKYEDLPFDGAARAAVAAIQEQQLRASREGRPDKTEDYHQMIVTSSTVLEIRERARMFGERYPELTANEDQVRQLDAIYNFPAGTSRGTSIITALTTLPPAGDMGIYPYFKYRDQVIQAAARYVVIDMGGRQGSLEQPAAERDHAAITPVRPLRFG